MRTRRRHFAIGQRRCGSALMTREIVCAGVLAFRIRCCAGRGNSKSARPRDDMAHFATGWRCEDNDRRSHPRQFAAALVVVIGVLASISRRSRSKQPNHNNAPQSFKNAKGQASDPIAVLGRFAQSLPDLTRKTRTGRSCPAEISSSAWRQRATRESLYATPILAWYPSRRARSPDAVLPRLGPRCPALDPVCNSNATPPSAQ